MLCGRLPFVSDDIQTVFNSIRNLDFDKTFPWPLIPTELQALISSLLTVENDRLDPFQAGSAVHEKFLL